MITILTDPIDEQSKILHGILKIYNIPVMVVHPQDVLFFYMSSKDSTYIELNNGVIINSCSDFFINRIPNLYYNHPLVLFLYAIPHNKVLTHPAIGSIILSKLNLLKYFKRYPNTTIIKNSSFKKSKNICIKSISQVRSIVRPSTDAIFFNDAVEFMPIQLQTIIRGEHIKTHIIGDDYFSYQSISNTLDPRESNAKIQYIPTPSEIVAILSDLKKTLGINYFDCDLIYNGGKVTILEINSSPAPLVFAIDSECYDIFDRFVRFIINKEYSVNEHTTLQINNNQPLCARGSKTKFR